MCSRIWMCVVPADLSCLSLASVSQRSQTPEAAMQTRLCFSHRRAPRTVLWSEMHDMQAWNSRAIPSTCALCRWVMYSMSSFQMYMSHFTSISSHGYFTQGRWVCLVMSWLFVRSGGTWLYACLCEGKSVFVQSDLMQYLQKCTWLHLYNLNSLMLYIKRRPKTLMVIDYSAFKCAWNGFFSKGYSLDFRTWLQEFAPIQTQGQALMFGNGFWLAVSISIHPKLIGFRSGLCAGQLSSFTPDPVKPSFFYVYGHQIVNTTMVEQSLNCCYKFGFRKCIELCQKMLDSSSLILLKL